MNSKGLRGAGLGSPYDAEGPAHFPEDCEPAEGPAMSHHTYLVCWLYLESRRRDAIAAAERACRMFAGGETTLGDLTPVIDRANRADQEIIDFEAWHAARRA